MGQVESRPNSNMAPRYRRRAKMERNSVFARHRVLAGLRRSGTTGTRPSAAAATRPVAQYFCLVPPRLKQHASSSRHPDKVHLLIGDPHSIRSSILAPARLEIELLPLAPRLPLYTPAYMLKSFLR